LSRIKRILRDGYKESVLRSPDSKFDDHSAALRSSVEEVDLLGVSFNAVSVGDVLSYFLLREAISFRAGGVGARRSLELTLIRFKSVNHIFAEDSFLGQFRVQEHAQHLPVERQEPLAQGLGVPHVQSCYARERQRVGWILKFVFKPKAFCWKLSSYSVLRLYY
jgi:hypothetical protein